MESQKTFKRIIIAYGKKYYYRCIIKRNGFCGIAAAVLDLTLWTYRNSLRDILLSTVLYIIL